MSNEFVVKKGLILNNQAPVKFTDASGTIYVAVQAPSAVSSGNVNITLPGSYGTSGQILATNSSGTLSWVTPASITSGSVTSGFIGDSAVVSGSVGSGQISKFHIASGQIVKGLTQGSNVTITVDSNDIYTISATISGGVAVSPLTIASGLSLSSGSFFDGSTSMTAGIASGGIVTNLIADNAITSSKIASGSIGTYHIAQGAITDGLIASGAITSGMIGNNAVFNNNIASGGVGSGKLSDGSVYNNIIASGGIGLFKLASGSVTSGTLGDGSVHSGDVASGAIFNNNIASGGVLSGKLGNSSVASGSIGSGQIGTNHIASGVLTPTYISGTANQILGINAGTTANEYKTLAAAGNISITNNPNLVTIGTTGAVPLGHYISAYSDATQANTGLASGNLMTYNVVSEANGISIRSGSNIVFGYPGTYNVQFSAQLDKTDSGEDNIDIWLKLNGANVLDSNTQLTLPINDAKGVAAWNWVLSVASGDYTEIAWYSADADLRLLAINKSGTITPDVPSVIMTAVQVMNTSAYGTVTNVDLSLPNQFVVSGNPVVSSGTLSAAWAYQPQNTFLAAPANTSGTPSFRVISSGDLISGQVMSGSISSGQIGTNHIASGVVVGFLTSGIITSGMIGSGVVFNNNIASGGVGSGKLADGSVNSGNVSSGSIGLVHLASGTVFSGTFIASGTVQSGSLGNAAVVSGSIASGQVNNFHLSSGTATGNLLSGSVLNTQLANNSVTINGASTALGGSYTNAALTIGTGLTGGSYNGSGAVTIALASGAAFTNLLSGSIGSGLLANNSVVSGSIASGQIGVNHLISGLITTLTLGSGQVTSGNIASGVVFRLLSGSITSGFIGDNALNSGNISSGQIFTLHIASGGLLSGAIGSGQIGQFHLASGVGGGGGGASLTSGSVTSGFIGNAAVVSGSIGSGQISYPHIAVTSGFTAGQMLAISYSGTLYFSNIDGGTF